MLNDPQSIKYGTNAAISLPRVPAPAGQGAFASPDNTSRITITHLNGKRSRTSIRLRHAKTAPDPLTAINTEFSLSVTLSLDTPLRGYTEAEMLEVVSAFQATCSADLVKRLLGGEA